MKTRFSLLQLLTALFVLVLPTSGHALNPASSPLFLNSPAAPNIMFTLDDSGSMQWEILPESITYFAYLYPAPANMYGGVNYANQVPNFNTTNAYNTFLRSQHNNKIYYNPSVTYKPWASHDGTLWPNASPTCAYHNPANTAAGCRNLTVDNTDSATWYTGTGWTAANTAHTYYPAVYFRYNSGNVWSTGSYTRIQIKSANAPFTGDGRASRTDCTSGSCTYAQEIQNFANWYSYYRSRISLARTGVGHAFANQSSNFRVGFAAINKTSATIDGVSSPGAIVRGVRPFSGTDRQTFFNDFYTYTINTGDTPLRRAMDNIGKYFERTDDTGPWGKFPGTGGGSQYSCRQNYNIFMTDGYWNSDAAPTAGATANVDGTAGSVITGTSNGQSASYTYSPSAPYSDSYSNTLADVAMYYWKRDLRTDLTNNVPTSTANPAFWQQMVNFTVGLGVTGTLNPATDLAALANGTLSWPQPSSGSTTGVNVDDLWHAAVNSRGGFFSASDPETFAQSLSDALVEISKRTSSSSSVATSTNELRSGSKYFQSLSINGEWSGTLVSKLISNDALQWDAAAQVSAQQLTSSSDTRTILTRAGNSGVAFLYNNLTAAQKTQLDTGFSLVGGVETATVDNRGAQRVGYLRGHSQYEGNTSADFRQRPNRKIGDIVHSSPWFVGPPSAGYSESDNPGYKAFRDANLARLPIVYVGANDGMLHGFNSCEVGQAYAGNVTCTTAMAGKEAIAYVPSSMYDKLSWLTSQDYGGNHKYFVDGSPMVGDAQVNGVWRSVLVGSLNSGGRAYYALDVTNPANFIEANAASLYMWEFTGADDSDLGLSYNLPPIKDNAQPHQIAKMANGKWAAIVGNGYNSSSGKSALFILFLDGPNAGSWTQNTHYKKLVADTSGNNGLSVPMPFDSDGDGKIDVVYAGDLKGNLWKFDVSNSDPANWQVALSGSPLYIAKDSTGARQPIINPPAVAKHPESGQMVMFATGKYIEANDVFDTQAQTFYSIRDIAIEVNSRNELIEQTLNNSLPRLIVSTHAATAPQVDATGNPINLGCFLDLSILGERITGRPRVIHDKINFDTIVPNSDVCEGGVDSINMTLIYKNCAMSIDPVYDANDDNVISSNEQPVVGISTGSNLSGITFIKIGDGAYKFIAPQLPGSVLKKDTDFGDTGGRGRITWREIVQ